MDEPIRESGPRLAQILANAIAGDGPLYRQLADGLKHAIDRGEIPQGSVLPPERVLARSLAVSRSTVVAAYERLKSEGWLDSRQGSGTWVRDPDEDAPTGVDAVATGRVFLTLSGDRHPTGSDRVSPDDDVIDLSVASLAGTGIIADAIASLRPEEIETLTAHHGYQPQGLRSLREAVAERFTATGLDTSADQLIVTTGAHQALSLVARQVLQAGDTVLVESPTFPGALDVFRRFAARAVPVPADGDGLRTDSLADLVARTDPVMIYLTPHFHSPTGGVMPIERRRQLGEIAAETGIVVVEDLALADLALDDVDLPPPVAAVAEGATVHTIGSTAKLFWAGLRIGWLRSPDSWAVRMLATKTVADLGSPLISQLIAVRLLERGEEIRAQRRDLLRPRRDLLCRLIEETLPGWQFVRPQGGLSVWATLPHGNADEFAEIALRHGVAVVPGPSLSVDEGNRRALRLVFSRPEPEIEEGMRRLAQAWEAYAPLPTPRSSARLLV